MKKEEQKNENKADINQMWNEKIEIKDGKMKGRASKRVGGKERRKGKTMRISKGKQMKD